MKANLEKIITCGYFNANTDEGFTLYTPKDGVRVTVEAGSRKIVEAIEVPFDKSYILIDCGSFANAFPINKEFDFTVYERRWEEVA